MNNILSVEWVRKFVKDVSGGVLPLYHVESLGNAVFGALFSKRLSISDIGRSFAKRTGRCPKHAIKQVDRLVGNNNIETKELFRQICSTVVGVRKKIQVSMDWTEYDYSDQSRVTINLITKHGRATPLVWISAVKSRLKNHRSQCEKKVLRLLANSLAEDIEVIVVADRGFGSVALMHYIREKLGWHYIIRIKGCIEIFDREHPLGCRIEELRLIRGAAPRMLSKILLTLKKYPLAALVAVWDREMKEPWYLATSMSTYAEQVVKYYSRRFTCEEHYRDEKDDRFGAGSKETLVGSIERRDMLTLIHAIATIILTIVGAAGELIGYDRRLKANTEKYRTHSLYRQGKEYVDGIEYRFVELFRGAIKIIRSQHAQLGEMYSVI